jgi:hypothetical protein
MNSHEVEKHGRLTTLVGLDVRKKLLLPVEGEVFFLTSPFIERAYRTTGFDVPLATATPAVPRLGFRVTSNLEIDFATLERAEDQPRLGRMPPALPPGWLHRTAFQNFSV